MRQGICDVRRAAAWLADRPEVDRGRLGVTGISLGGIVSSIVGRRRPDDPRRGLPAGRRRSVAGSSGRCPRARPSARCGSSPGRTLADLKALTDPFDPLAYAPRLRGKRVFMMAGKVDEVVPPDCARALWEAAGRPPIRWYDCGHYSAVGFLLPGIRRTVDFFAEPGGRSSRERNRDGCWFRLSETGLRVNLAETPIAPIESACACVAR